MLRQLLKSKIHGATVTEANLHYDGSITIDETLLHAADLLPYERVQVLNLNNGARFETYTIPGPAGSGTLCVNGAAARLVHPGDRVLILSYLWLDEASAQSHKPIVLHVDERNRPLAGRQSSDGNGRPTNRS